MEVAAPMLAKAVLERIRPEDCMAPAVVVAMPTPKPPDVPPAVGAPTNREPPMERAWAGEVVATPTLPVSKILMASVKNPDLKVENARLPFPVLKF